MNWNDLPKPTDEVDLQAKPYEPQFFYGGFAWLLQFPSCNVVCLRYKPTKTTFKKSLQAFLRFLKKQQIQYIRVEGSPGRYNFLQRSDFFPKLKHNGLNVVRHQRESAELGRDVFYIKVY